MGVTFGNEGVGVVGTTAGSAGVGVYGSGGGSGIFYGVHGEVSSPDRSSAAGYFQSYGAGYAGYFYGNVHVRGTLSKNSGSFMIDHPLDPANKYLQHSFVESPDMMNVYNGNAVLDDKGEASVHLPEYFEALNCDFRYQLTPVGAPGPNLYIAEKITDNRFRIAGGQPGMEVSWQVTGVRQDPYAVANRIKVEVCKSDEDRGRYLNPEVYGLSDERSVVRAHNTEHSPIEKVAKDTLSNESNGKNDRVSNDSM